MKTKVKIGVFLVIVVSILFYINSSYSYVEKKNGNEENVSYIVEVKEDYNEYFWQYKTEINKIVFARQADIMDYIKKWDISTQKNQSIMAYLTLDGEQKVLYIVGDEIKANPNSSYLFADFTNLEEIENLNYLDTTEVNDMSYMFLACAMLRMIDLNGLRTENVTNMSYMFASDINLVEVLIDELDTEKVETWAGMFFECSSIEEINLTNLRTDNLKNMADMFRYATNLRQVDLSNVNTSKVTDMSFMFDNCSSLQSLDLSNFVTANVEDMRGMFANCSALENLNISSFDFRKTKKVGYDKETTIPTYIEYGMFYNSPLLRMTFTINNSDMAYMYMFDNNQDITLDYTKEGEALVDKVVGFNIKKGMLKDE